MTTNGFEDNDKLKDWDAAYVLGALNTEDRRLYEGYLQQNPDRAAEVAQLSGVPRLLGMLPAEEAVALADRRGAESTPVQQPPISELARSIRRQQKRRTLRSLGISVTAVAAVAAGAFVLGANLAIPVTPSSTIQATNSASTVLMPMVTGGDNIDTADLRIVSKSWGTLLTLDCTYNPEWTDKPTTFMLVLTDSQGLTSTIATWSATDSGAQGLSAATALNLSGISSIEIRAIDEDESLASLQL